MIDISDFIRLPTNAEAALIRHEQLATYDASARSEDPLVQLADRVSQHQLSNIVARIAGKAYLLAFVRGSTIKNRLAVAQTYWNRMSECLGLRAITDQLEQAYGRQPTNDALCGIRHHISRTLLRDGDKMGPAKLVVRLRRPGDGFLTNKNYPAVERFMCEVATLSEGCDELTKALFLGSHLGEARQPVVKQLRYLLERFELSGVVSALDAHFDDFIDRLKQTESLHPAVTIHDAAVAQVAALLGTDKATARKAITLFRFAWICRLRKEKDFSDFTIKSLVVAPQSSDDERECRQQTEALLQQVFASLDATADSCPDLTEWSRHFPDVRVRLTAYAMTLPAPLYAAFDRIEAGEDRLDCVTKYHAGSHYLRRLIVDSSMNGGNTTSSRLVSQEWDKLYRRVVLLKTKTSKAGDLKHEQIKPLGISPDSLTVALAAAINDPGQEHVQHCSELLTKINKADFVGNIRGIWTVKS